MHAVKGGHIDTVKVLMECKFLKYDLQNKVCVPLAPTPAPTVSIFYRTTPPPLYSLKRI